MKSATQTETKGNREGIMDSNYVMAATFEQLDALNFGAAEMIEVEIIDDEGIQEVGAYVADAVRTAWVVE